jgi:hypothetical protein
MDSFTEVTSQSWISRIMGSFKSVLFGIVIFLLSFIVLFWNEGRAVKTAKGLKEGRGLTVEANSSQLSPENDGNLIHLSGKVISSETLSDEQFNIAENALKLKRTVEMYQWEEKTKSKKKKKIGGGEETKKTYSYVQKWSNTLNDSKKFKIIEGHVNPFQMPFEEYEKEVTNATMGEFTLSENLIYQLFEYENQDIPGIDSLNIENASIVNDGEKDLVYIGKGSNTSPEIGDVRISFSKISHGDYSILSKQVKNTLETYNTSYGTNINVIKKGILSADNMFTSEEEDNVIITWLLRFAGFFMMFIGLVSIFKPLVVIADVLPFFGNLLSFGVAVFAGIFSFALTFMTIAIAWVFYRPILGISLILIAIAAIVFFYRMANKDKVV